MPRKSHPNLLYVLTLTAGIGLLLIVGITTWLWFQSLLKPVSTNPQTQVFVVKKGQSLDSIGQNLESTGLIHSRLAFKLIVTQKNLSTKIQAGTFKLSPSMSTIDIATNLTHGTLDTWITLLEGWRREEIATYLETTLTQAGSPFSAAVFVGLTEGREGYLFPDSYLIPLGAAETKIVSILSNTFDQKVTQDLASEISSSDKSLETIMIMASLIEREARSATARAMVSGILWRRLDSGWPLQVDATLQYAKGYDATDQTWWTPPTALDKTIASPYNTYQNPGLPPNPICNPSLSAIKAAIKPTPSSYWYYLTGNDNQMHYAETLEEHNANIQKYL